MDRASRQVRSAASKFETREEGNELKIEGYFAVFNSNYQIFDDLSESVAPGAFDDTLGDDIRALINHDSSLVLGRNTAHTLDLRQDEHGLWGSITINPNDQDAMNLYARVQRGDVDQCSFGFDILSEDYDVREDGSVHWTIRKVRLYEVSVCTFPAYEETNVKARSAQRDEIKKRSLEAWKVQTLAKLKGEK
ncbi:MAG: HK97 family phage prohead protease [Clostridiales bacterium]|jgi:HK97 family phage prohead protease|nr:HK97 family phage prohead protease [Clostridiales bacterium]